VSARGLRIPVATIVGLMAEGHPMRADIQAAMRYGADTS